MKPVLRSTMLDDQIIEYQRVLNKWNVLYLIWHATLMPFPTKKERPHVVTSCHGYAICVTGPQRRVQKGNAHYNGVIISAMASQITGVSIVYSTVCSGTDQRKNHCSASLAFVRGIHRSPVNSKHKGPVTRKCFQLMTSSYENAHRCTRSCQIIGLVCKCQRIYLM